MKKITIAAALLAVLATIYLYSCKKNETSNDTTPTEPRAVQSLPGGKQYFTVCYGNLDAIGSVWVGMANYTFVGSTGTVTKQYWHWDNSLERGKTAFNTHSCTMDGVTKTVTTYVPTGWILPSGYSTTWSGTYVYNTTTNVLSITFSNGKTETWNVSLPETALAMLNFASSNYSITHGRGYGSLRSWSTYKTVAQIPRDKYYYHQVTLNGVTGGAQTLNPTTIGTWTTATRYTDLSTWSASPTGNAIHMKDASTACSGGCQTGRTGIIYHIASNNNSRQMAYYNFCACLPSATSYPNYTGQLHPLAVSQIIDDNGNMRGMVGIEQQDEAGYSDFQYSLFEWKRL